MAALRLTPEGAPAEQRIALHAALAGSHAATGHFAEARAALLEGLALLPGDSTLVQVRLTAACAGVEQLLGEHEAAHARLLGALDALGEPGSDLAVELMVSLALSAFFRQDFADASRWSERALQVARPLEDRALIAAAAGAGALSCSFVGATDDAGRHAAEAAAIIDAMSDAELATRLDAAAFLAGGELYLDRFERTTGHSNRALALARATGQGELLPMLIPTLATALAASGRLVEAAEVLDAAIEGARLAGNRQGLAWSLLNRGYVATMTGDLDLASAATEEGMDLTRGLDESHVSTYAGVCRAMAYLATGDAARAAPLFVTSAGGDDLPLIPGGWRAHFLEMLTSSWLMLGRRTEAESAAACAEAVATATRLPMARAWAHRAAGSVALDAGDATGAAARALDSAALAAEAGAPVESALSRTLAGRALALAGRPAEAIEQLKRAAADLEAHGALRFRDEAEREMRRLGHRIHRRSAPGDQDAVGVASLSARELPGRAPARRSPDQPRDRRRAVPQPEDDRGSHPQHVPQARRVVPRRHRARGRARRSDLGSGRARLLIRPLDGPGDLGTGGDAQLHEHAADVRLDRLAAEEERRRDLGVGPAVHEEPRHLELALRQ